MMQRDEIALLQLRHVANIDGRRLPVREPVDPARGTMDAVVVVALAGIAPVEDEHAAIGAISEVDAAEPGIGREEDVGLVPPDVAAARSFEPLDVDAPAVKVEREQLAADTAPATGRPGRSSGRYEHVRRRGDRRFRRESSVFL